jgi:hypothetical protein
VDVAKLILVDGAVLAVLKTDNVDIVVKNIQFLAEQVVKVVMVVQEEVTITYLVLYLVLVGLLAALIMDVDPQMVQQVKLVDLVVSGVLVVETRQIRGTVVHQEVQFPDQIIL